MTIVSLPMYDLPEAAGATDALWRGLAEHLRRAGIEDVPGALTRHPSLPAHWLAPDLLFSQTCGFPLRHVLKGRVRLVATPCYAVPGCEGPSYRSLILVRAGSRFRSLADLRDSRAAFNARDSQSGYNAFRSVIAPLARDGRFFAEVVETGSHAASLEAVAAGRADVAAVDCVSIALFARYRRPVMREVREIGRTPSAPGLPYITSMDTGEDLLGRLRAGLQGAMADPALAAAREALLLDKVTLLPDSAYERIDEMEAAAVATGYAELA
jgi:ABC-type phosphate/phosphonate transport system substrate-binding protein